MVDQDHLAGAIPQRPLGRTGVKVSALGLGGHHPCTNRVFLGLRLCPVAKMAGRAKGLADGLASILEALLLIRGSRGMRLGRC